MSNDSKKPKAAQDSKKASANEQEVDLYQTAKNMDWSPSQSTLDVMQHTVETLVYGFDFSEKHVTDFVDRMQYFVEDVNSIAELEEVLPDDAKQIMVPAEKAIKAYFKEPKLTDPFHLAEQQSVFIAWKYSLGELSSKYTALGLGKDLAYYGMRGSAFVALTNFGHSLEQNVKLGKTVEDRKNQAQTLTNPIAKERVYYTWLSKKIDNLQWTISDIVKNIDELLIEARRERKASEITQK